MPRPWAIFAIVALLTAGAAGFGWWWTNRTVTQPITAHNTATIPAIAPPLALPEPSRYDPAVVASADNAYQAVIAAPTDPAMRGRHAMVLHANGALRTAEASYGHAIDLDAENPRWWFYRGLVRAQLGRVADAIADYTAGIQRSSTHPAIFWNRGFLALDLGQLDAAEQDFRAALDLDPRNLAAAAGLARVMLEQNDPAGAIALLRPHLEERSQHNSIPYLHGLIARGYRQQGDDELARTHLAKADGVFPAWPDPWMEELLALRVSYGHRLDEALQLLEQNRPAEALQILDSIAEERPDDVAVLIARAHAHTATGDSTRAMALLEQVIEIDPGHAAANINLSIAHQQRGDLAAARACIDRALERDPRSGAAHERLAQLQLLDGQTAEAARSLERALEYGFDSIDTRIQLGRLFNSLGKADGARRVLEPAIEGHRDHPSLWVTLAWTFATLGQAERADAALERARTLHPDDPFDLTIIEHLTRERSP